MSQRRVLVLFGILCLLAATVFGAVLLSPSTASAAGTWATERIYSDTTNEVFRVRAQDDYVVWATNSRAEGEYADLFVYTISTKQTKRIAGRDLAFHIDEEPVLDGTHVVWEEETSDEASDIILYDIATEQTKRLSGGALDTYEMHPCVQGDWVVWDGSITPGPGDWVYEPVVFAYRISTSGPVQIIRWRDHETQQYPESYRSMDDSPTLWNGKLCWRFERPDGGQYLGVLDLTAGTVGWTWRAPDGQSPGGLIWNDHVLIVNAFMAGQLYHQSLMLRSPGQSTPEVLVADTSTYLTGTTIRGGVAVWAAGDVYFKKPGGQVAKLANTSGVMDLTSDGSHLAWSRQGAIWWYDISTGESVSIPGATGGNPAIAGTQVAWTGDYMSGVGYRGVYLATRGTAGFPDVPTTHPYYTAISGMAARGIIGGYTNGNFGPGDLVIRQQFAKMIVKTLGLSVTGTEVCPFVDVSAGTGADPFYPAKYVAVCALNNITKGIDATHFAPTRNITRAQMITMVVRAADNLAAGSLQAVPTGWVGQLSYGDVTHGANIQKAEFNGLLAGIQGPGGTLAGWNTDGNATRGEVAQMLWNLLQMLP